MKVVEICAGAGGQALGLEFAGFEHELAVDLDEDACTTLRQNRPSWNVREGDIASGTVWQPSTYEGVDLLAGGVPCPPFTAAGKQLGATDERDLFAWAIDLCERVQPRALLLENVRGLSMPRFAAYRQHVLDRLHTLGYISAWKLLNSSNFGVPQLRPRFILVAMRPADFQYFTWPDEAPNPPTVGEALRDLMAADGWPGVDRWAAQADDIAPTLVGGSKKHGGADVGPTRAKKAWNKLGVYHLSLGDAPPSEHDSLDHVPKLTCAMAARIQGWDQKRYVWTFHGRKTSMYRQIANALPPPVAEAIGTSIRTALLHQGHAHELIEKSEAIHDPVYFFLRKQGHFKTIKQISAALPQMGLSTIERHINHLSRDFDLEKKPHKGGVAYKIGDFKAFRGSDHNRRRSV